ncbi:MAG TPA: glycosyltransferase [bacterium]|nr:glycosyltransferase [bacterium]
MSESPSLTIVLNARNKQATLADAVQQLASIASYHFPTWEILLYDNGGTDGTGALADELAAADERITVVHFRRRRKLGAVFFAGLKRARMNHFLFLGRPQEVSPKGLDALLSHGERAEIVMLVRTDPRGPDPQDDKFLKTINRLLRLNLRSLDYTMLLHTATARAVKVEPRNAIFLTELLVKLLRRGHSCVEVNVAERFGGRRAKSIKLPSFFGKTRFLWSAFWTVRRRSAE